MLDKTGTITIGNRRATQFIPLGGGEPFRGRLGSRAWPRWPTPRPEGKSILDLANQQSAVEGEAPSGSTFIEFTAQNRMSGVDLPDGSRIRKGAPDTLARYVQDQGGTIPEGYQSAVDAIASSGATPLAVAEGNRLLGVIKLEDILKPGISERFVRLRQMGLRVVMVTGDNPLTAKAIAQQAGVDDFIAQATPEAKLAYIRKEQEGGKLVAMMGDGTNDAPALAAGRHRRGDEPEHPGGRQGGRQHGRPRQRPHRAHRGRRDQQATLLMTRGGPDHVLDRQRPPGQEVLRRDPRSVRRHLARVLEAACLDLMGLATRGGAYSAILAAVIFNAIIIPMLIPIALKGVTYRPVGAAALLRRNLLYYGLGGVIAPFIGIKLIDLGLDPLLGPRGDQSIESISMNDDRPRNDCSPIGPSDLY